MAFRFRGLLSSPTRITRTAYSQGRFFHSRRTRFPSDNLSAVILGYRADSARHLSITHRHYASNTTIRVPAMAESITEGTLSQLTKEVGDFIEQDEELATIETDKIDVSANAPHSGVIQKLLVHEGDTVTVDQAIAEIVAQEVDSSQSRQELEEQHKPTLTANEPRHDEPRNQTLPSSTAETKQSPAPPTKNEEHPQNSVPSSTAVQPNSGGLKPSRREQRVKMPRIRQVTAKHLKESQNTAAFLTTFNEVDMSNIMEFRKKHRDTVLEKHGVKLGFMGIMARASVLALKQIPAVNASIENGDTILHRDYVDLSVAAAIPKGLVTPVLRNIESMSIVEIEKGIAELVAKARDGKLTLDDLKGGSFTISNSGIWGSLFGTPIINMPQSAVLGTYGIQDRPMAVNGRVEIRPMMYIALTYDHRIIDGREGTTFLKLVKDHLESPERMLLE